MKRIPLLLVLLLGVVSSAWAQDTKRERNVLGAPVYYDTLGNVRGTPAPRGGVAVLPKHHYFNRLSNDYCSFFLEAEGMFGPSEIALGGSLTYLPERWGLYGSALMGSRHGFASVGPVLRLSDYGGSLDWHLYGGLVVSRRLGVEAGVRMALPRRNSGFCWESVSVGASFVNGHAFFTCGLSLELLAVVATSVYWW